MTPALAAAAGLACYLVGLQGVKLLRSSPAPVGFNSKSASTPAPTPKGSSPLDRILGTLGSRLSRPMLEILGEQRQERIAQKLALAGYPDGFDVESFAGRKAAWTVLATIPATSLAFMGHYVPALALFLTGWFLVDAGIWRQARVRQAEIANTLPDFLDIVGVTITAGASFQSALERVAHQLPGPLSEEILTTLRQIDIGASRRAAFEGLRKRTNVGTLDAFTSALLQAEELGAPLSDTLRGLASEMRVERSQNIRRKAAETAPKISLVVIMLIVPATLLLAVTGIFMGADFSLDHLSPTTPAG